MALEKIYDMAWEIEGGQALIEQDSGCGETDRVVLHPIHVRLIASEMGLLEGNADAWSRVETLERRLRILCERIGELDSRLWSVPVFPPGSKNDDPDLWYSDATLTIAQEFCADLAPSTAPRATSEPAAPKRAAPAPGGQLPLCEDGAAR